MPPGACLVSPKQSNPRRNKVTKYTASEAPPRPSVSAVGLSAIGSVVDDGLAVRKRAKAKGALDDVTGQTMAGGAFG